MIGIIKLLYLLLAVFVTGDVVNTLLFKKDFKKHLSLRAVLSYGLGTGTLTLLMFYFSFLGGDLSFRNIVFISFGFFLLFGYYCIADFRFAFPRFSIHHENRTITFLKIFLSGLILAWVSIITFRALFLPMHLSDAVIQWGFKAKILYHEGTIYAPDFFDDPLRMVYHCQYPFLVPLLESFIFVCLDQANDVLAKIPFPLFFVALLVFVYDAQKKYSSSLQALMVTAGMALLPVFLKDVKGNPSSGYAEVPLIFYYTVPFKSSERVQ